MGVITLPRQEDPNQILQSFLAQYMNRQQQQKALEQNQSQFDASHALDRERTTAQVGQATAATEGMRADTSRQNVEVKMKGFLDNVFNPMVKNGRQQEAAQLAQAFLRNNPDVKDAIAGYAMERPNLDTDAAAANTAQFAKNQTGLANTSQDAQARNFAFKNATGDQMTAPVFGDQAQRQTTPEAYGRFIEREGGARPTANASLAANTQVQMGREQNASAEKIAGMRVEATGNKADFSQEKALRDQYLKQVKTFPELKDQIARVNEAARDASGQSDVALLFNFMKMLDPSSVVRESEYATAANTGSLLERAGAAFNRVQNGQRLTASQRAEFVAVANRLHDAVAPRYENVANEYRKLAADYGLDPERVVQGIGEGGGGRMSKQQRNQRTGETRTVYSDDGGTTWHP